jgi:hypothetical protein
MLIKNECAMKAHVTTQRLAQNDRMMPAGPKELPGNEK